jgi:sugar lactone lactonase YvrE
VKSFPGVQIDDPRLAEVLPAEAPLLRLYEGTLHGEGQIWVPADGCLYWSDVPNRRLLKWHLDGKVTVAIDGTYFMNGNAIDGDGRVVHCEHGRRCISRSDTSGNVEPIVTHFEGKRLNSPNDITVAGDGASWFTDPTFGLLMPNQGSLADPELDHRSVYRFDPATKELRRLADFEQPNGLFFSPDGRTLYVSDRRSPSTRYLDRKRVEPMRSRPSTSAPTVASPTGASSVTPTTAIPMDLWLMGAAGSGPRPPMAFTSSHRIALRSATSQLRRSLLIARLAVRV